MYDDRSMEQVNNNGERCGLDVWTTYIYTDNTHTIGCLIEQQGVKCRRLFVWHGLFCWHTRIYTSHIQKYNTARRVRV